jgi:succinyl-CoA synthetase beta subunit
MELLAANGVPVIPSAAARDVEEAVAAAALLGYPVALKIASADIPHKSDVGGVALALESETALRRAHAQMMRSVTEALPAARIDGVVLAPMRQGGTELLVGIVRDPIWGLTLAVALGGVWVEIMKDSALRVLPVDRDTVAEMLRELKGFDLLTGARGGRPADLDALTDVIHRIGGLAVGLGDRLMELEVNPLRVDGATIEALDAFVRWPEGD